MSSTVPVRLYVNGDRYEVAVEPRRTLADALREDCGLTGTHLGPLRLAGRTIEPTGRAFRVRMAASFEFAPGEAKIVCERPYFDQGAVLRALGL